jgi:hypothetical protein
MIGAPSTCTGLATAAEAFCEHSHCEEDGEVRTVLVGCCSSHAASS